MQTILLTFSYLADNTQNVQKVCVKGLQCRRGPALQQHIPQRKPFPIKWQSPGGPPRSVKVKNPTPQKRLRNGFKIYDLCGLLQVMQF